MSAFFELPEELRTLQGEAVTRLTDEEFYQFCQDNLHFQLELSGEPVLPGFQLDLRPLRRS